MGARRNKGRALAGLSLYDQALAVYH